MSSSLPRATIDLVNDRICTVKDAAQHYSVSTPTVWRWILSERIPSVKLGNSRRTSIEGIARAFQSEADAG